ncbi:MAG: hypothetical protein KKE17_11635, partial [Proteobacteria bacterium]|nr:hypothetical protein [Pseudomonadota bacterium]MBU1710646.1 hypothetical protein [Pseudomonadota bacterium]
MRNKVLLLLLVTVLSLHSVRAFAASPSAEPDIADYTAPPTFMINSIEPNIMIILDNSGSMNYNAYGIWPGNGKLVTGNSFTGSPYDTNTHFDVRVSDSRDDAEESSGSAYYATGDLYLGRWDDARPTYVGIRFQNVAIPQGVKVQRAYIEFNVNSPKIPPYDGKIFLKIQGEDVDDAAQYSAVANGISGRAKTKTAVPWSNSTSPDLEPWGPANEKQETADIASIVQEILDRDGWASGNAINFIISYHTGMGSKNRRDATAYDGDPANAPLLHIEYTSDEIQEYYGYFNPNWFYTYSSNKFIHKYEKVCRIETNKDVYYSIDYGESCNEPGIILADDEHIKSARYDYDKSCTVQTDPVPDAWYVADTSGVKKCLTDADISSAGESLWDGNWMNWVSMRRIDVARKVLMGGLATSRTGGGNQTLFGEKPAQTDRVFWKQFDSSTSPALTPYDGKYKYKLQEGYIYVFDAFDTQKAKLTLGVEADEAYESWEFVDGNISGVLQKFGDRAEWGNEFFYYGSGKDQEGGKISNRIGTNLTTLITDLQNTGADTWTPLAEAYYVAMQYFKQEKPDASLGYSNSAIGAVNNTNDPFYRDAEFVSCPKNFVLMLTDGSSTEDKNIPAFLKNYDGDNHEDSSHADYRSYGDNGSDYLDDIALYGRTNDLRVDLEGNQNLIFFPVYAFGDDANARKLLKDAARNGGFVDKNANNRPDGDYTDSDAERLEWDTDGDGIPDTYFEAKDGKVLRKALEKAINAMLERASSGTAVSVLATSSEGEGNVVQAYFKPTIKTGDDEARWVGYLQSVWLDSKGNLREDTIADKALKIAEDKVLSYTVAADGNTEVYKYAVSESHPYPDFESDVPDVVAMEDIVPLWEAGVMLAARNLDAFPRTIFTYIDDAAVPKDIA